MILLQLLHERKVLNIEEGDVDNHANDHGGAYPLNHLQHPRIQRLAPHRLNNAKHDMAAVQNRDGQHVNNGQVNVEDHTEPECKLPAVFALKQKIVNPYNPDWPAEMLQFHVRFWRRNCGNRVQCAGDAVVNLLDRGRTRDR